MENKKVFLVIFIFALSIGGWYFIKTQTDSKKKSTNGTEKITSASHTKIQKKAKESKATKEDKRTLVGKSKISFEKYKDIYNGADVKTIFGIEDDNCDEKVEGKILKYSFVDFIFLKETEEGELTTIETASLEIGRVSLRNNQKCSIPTSIFIDSSKKEVTRLLVYKNCKCLLAGTLKPGEIFKFNMIQNIGRVSHKFKVPPEEELDFVSPDSNRKPEPYPYPILISDIKRPKEKEKQKQDEQKQKRITFKGVTTRLLNEWDLHPQDISYHTPEDFGSESLDVDKGEEGTVYKKDKYTFEIRPGGNGRITGGNVSVYGMKTFIPAGKKESWEARVRQLYLVQYKANVSSRTVDLSSGLDYQYDPEKNLRQKMSLAEYQINLKDKFDDRAIWLKKDFGGPKLASIYASEPYKENGKWKIRIDAPPGEYMLYFGNDVLERNFKWPPETSSEEQGSGSQGNK